MSARLTDSGLHALRVALVFGRGSLRWQNTGWSSVERRRVWVSPSAVSALARAGLAVWAGKGVYRPTTAGCAAAQARGIVCDCGAPILHAGACLCEGCERATEATGTGDAR